MSKIARRYVISIGGRVIAAVLQAAMVALLARSLGVENYGLYAIVSSIVLFALSIADLGMATAVLRLAADEYRQRAIGTIVLWRAFVTSLCLAASAAAGFLTDQNFALLYVATAVYMSGEMAGDTAVGVLQGERRAAAAMTLLIVRRLTAVVPFWFGVGLPQAYAALIVAGGVGFTLFIAIAATRSARPLPIREFLRTRGGIAVTSFGRNLANLDSFIVGATSGAQLAGLYGAAARLGNPINIAISTLVQVAIPELSVRQSPQQRYQDFRRMRPLVLLFGGLVALASLTAPWLVQILFGPDFAGAAPILAAVFVGAGFSAVAQLHMSWFVATRIPRSVSVGAVLTGVFGLVLLALLSSLLGVWGCAIAIVLWRATTLTIVLLSWYATTRVFRRPNPDLNA